MVNHPKDRSPNHRSITASIESSALTLIQEEFINTLRCWNLPRRAQHADDRQWKNHRSTPCADFAQVKETPLWEPNNFRRNRRHCGPGNLPKRSEIEIGKRIAVLCSTHGMHAFCSTNHVRCGQIVSRQFERKICLDGSRKIRGRSRILPPTSVGSLLRSKIVRDLAKDFYARATVRHRRCFLSKRPLHQQILGLQNGIALQLATEVSVIFLKRDKSGQRFALGCAKFRLK